MIILFTVLTLVLTTATIPAWAQLLRPPYDASAIGESQPGEGEGTQVPVGVPAEIGVKK